MPTSDRSSAATIFSGREPAGDGIHKRTEPVVHFVHAHSGMRFAPRLMEVAGYELSNGRAARPAARPNSYFRGEAGTRLHSVLAAQVT